eukprot:scaffold2318_cov363-Pavlova_lutheri.AAC.1
MFLWCTVANGGALSSQVKDALEWPSTQASAEKQTKMFRSKCARPFHKCRSKIPTLQPTKDAFRRFRSMKELVMADILVGKKEENELFSRTEMGVRPRRPLPRNGKRRESQTHK